MGLLGSGGPVAEVFSERYADDEASGRGFQAYKYFGISNKYYLVAA